MRNEVHWQEDENGHLLSIIPEADPFGMNWIEGHTPWGTVKLPDGLTVRCERGISPEGRLTERYYFKNTTHFPIFPQYREVGIYIPFNDSYHDASTSLERRCHTHIFCGESVSWVMALRMGGISPHLGLVLTAGKLHSYSVERDLNERSNDRGDFILHPELPPLQAGEETLVSWEFFVHQGEADFQRIIASYADSPLISSPQMTYFIGEEIPVQITVRTQNSSEVYSLTVDGRPLSMVCSQNDEVLTMHSVLQAEREGELILRLSWPNGTTLAKYFVVPSLETLVERRVRFICCKQQYRVPGQALSGAYLIYDRDDDKMYYSHSHDHNGGRERLAMGVLVARWLRFNRDEAILDSLRAYQTYVYRELYDRTTGEVFNDIGRNNDWHRLYNYPWLAVFQLELYELYRDKNYLLDSFRTLSHYYAMGGKNFYPIGMPGVRLFKALETETLFSEACMLKTLIMDHAAWILETGLNYPPSEVNYEQSIVAPGLGLLLTAYMLEPEDKWLEGIRRQIEVLTLFNAHQPNYHQFEVAIRHWDGYWFGKNRLYGDTYPHYWTVMSGMAFAAWGRILENPDMLRRAQASLRGALNLYFPDGSASCAMLFPDTVNGLAANYYDPWANDQDWALYYNYVERKLVELDAKNQISPDEAIGSDAAIML